MSTARPTTKDARRDAARQKARAMREAAARKHRRNRILAVTGGIVAVLLVAALVAVAVTRSGGSASAAAAPPGVTAGGGIVTGPASAAHTVAIYQDYQCPNCKAFDASVGPWLEQQRAAGVTKIEYRPISILDRSSGGTEYSTRSANAAACVAADGAADFTKFNDAMYAQQPPENGTGLPDSRLVTIARSAGAGSGVGGCITGGTYRTWVGRTTSTATGAGGVQGTPTVLVDGKVVPSSQQALATALGVKAP